MFNIFKKKKPSTEYFCPKHGLTTSKRIEIKEKVDFGLSGQYCLTCCLEKMKELGMLTKLQGYDG